MKIRTNLRRLPDGSAASIKRRATGILGIVCGVLTLGHAPLVMADPPLPKVPGGYEIRLVTAGGDFAGKHMAGIAVDRVTADIYVATDDIILQEEGSGSFDLWRITPGGVVSHVGMYLIDHNNVVRLAWGPGGSLYSANRAGDFFAIDPLSGLSSPYVSSGLALGNYGFQFDLLGDLILTPEGSGGSNKFYRVNLPLAGGGVTFLGGFDSANDDHGSGFGIQPDGDYVLYPDTDGALVTELTAAGHVDGDPFPLRHLTKTRLDASAPDGGLGIAQVNSIGAIDPVNGDVYCSSANFSRGSIRIAFTPGEVGPGATSSIFVDHIGNDIFSTV